MARFLGAAVLLILLVAVSMYGGTSLGRALERKPDSVSISVRGLIEYFTKELWGAKEDTRVVMANPRWVRWDAKESMQPARRHRPGTANQEVELEKEVARPRPRPRPRPRRSSNFSGEITDAWPRGVVKVGPWGGSGGQPFYMRGSSVPRLLSITLYHSSSAIHSLSCAYYLKRMAGPGAQMYGPWVTMAGPWGLPDSFGSTALRATIRLSADEHLTAIEGTSGHFGRIPDLVITSLSFRTNTGKTYGPYGEKRGTSFSVPAENGCIVGFWGRSGWLLDAIGVYIRACTPTPPVYRQRTPTPPVYRQRTPTPPQVSGVHVPALDYTGYTSECLKSCAIVASKDHTGMNV